MSYPEINVQVPTTPKLSVADLECHRHLVIFVQLFVKALARMRFHLDVVGIAGREEGGEDQKQARDQRHIGYGAARAREGFRVTLGAWFAVIAQE